jgi:hypothetical protein
MPCTQSLAFWAVLFSAMQSTLRLVLDGLTTNSFILLSTGTLRQMAATTAARGGQAGGQKLYLSLVRAASLYMRRMKCRCTFITYTHLNIHKQGS